MQLSQVHPVPVSVGCRGNEHFQFSQLVCLEVFPSIHLVDVRLICIQFSLPADCVSRSPDLCGPCQKLLVIRQSCVCLQLRMYIHTFCISEWFRALSVEASRWTPG